MAGTTTNYGWTYPTSTDLVKDGATAIQTATQGVDTTLFTALGGAYPGLRLIKKQTIGSAVSSVQVTGAFSATYDNYKILVVGGVGSTTSRLGLTLGATATGYAYATTGRSYSATGATFAQSSNTTSWPNAGTGTVNGINAEISLENPFNTTYTTVKTQSVAILTTDEFQTMGGFLNNTTSYTAFTLTPNAGTLTGGTIYVYGYGIS